MVTSYEHKMSNILGVLFRIFFVWGLVVLGVVSGTGAWLTQATEPSGWFTPSEYADAQLGHSFFWSVIFLFIFACTLALLRYTIVIYSYVALILFIIWGIKLMINRKESDDGGETTTKAYLVEHLYNVKCALSARGFSPRAYKTKAFCAFMLTLYSPGVIIALQKTPLFALAFIFQSEVWTNMVIFVLRILGYMAYFASLLALILL